MLKITCPHCNFQRQANDEGPRWQCPNCGKAYNKQNEDDGIRLRRDRRHTFSPDNSMFESWQKRLNLWLLIALCAAPTAFYYKSQPPSVADIDQSLQQEPLQSKTTKSISSFHYFDQSYNIKPMANYELRGLVVSHNNTTGMGDLYHDETSLDTKDLCVIWGDNIKTDDFHHVKFSSGAWTCHLEYPKGVSINLHQVANNHLITDSEVVRDDIANIRIGDQIKLKGWLVDYQNSSNTNFWRKSSLVRNDMGDGACEVVLVNYIEVIKQGNPRWYLLWQYSMLGIFLILLLKFIIVLIEVSPHRN